MRQTVQVPGVGSLDVFRYGGRVHLRLPDGRAVSLNPTDAEALAIALYTEATD